jgi:hypothetical protein
VIRQLLSHGFETFQISFGKSVGDANLSGLSDPVLRVLDACPFASGDLPRRISSIGVYGNPLTSPETVRDGERLIDAADGFGCDIVSGFAGRISGRPVPESYGRFGEVFRPLAACTKIEKPLSERRPDVADGLCGHANRSCTTTSDRASWPPLGMAGFTALPTASMKPITWSLGRLMISATFTGSKPIIGQES